MILGETRSSLVDPLLRRIGKPNEDDLSLADHPDEIDPYASTSRNNDQENVLVRQFVSITIRGTDHRHEAMITGGAYVWAYVTLRAQMR